MLYFAFIKLNILFMKRIILLIVLAINISTLSISAQDALTYMGNSHKHDSEETIRKPVVYEFNAFSRDYELESITAEMAGDHIFGETIAKKIYLLESKYTSEVEIVPGNPQTRTVIRKPLIYETVKRIEKLLKKEVKKGTLTSDSATTSLNKVLDVALNILASDTENFESAIEALDNTESKLLLFTNQVKLNY
jgi:viroplasmin and RNaseH domain-containing protein